MTTYQNPFHSRYYQDSKPIIETYEKPVEYKGYLIYKRNKHCFDIVKEGVCIGMRAGLNGAKKEIDELNETATAR